jgi:hypothetical protein
MMLSAVPVGCFSLGPLPTLHFTLLPSSSLSALPRCNFATAVAAACDYATRATRIHGSRCRREIRWFFGEYTRVGDSLVFSILFRTVCAVKPKARVHQQPFTYRSPLCLAELCTRYHRVSKERKLTNRLVAYLILSQWSLTPGIFCCLSLCRHPFAGKGSKVLSCSHTPSLT